MRQFAVFFLFFTFTSLHAQSILKGKVFDAASLEGIEGALVVNVTDSIGSFTGEGGYFTLSAESDKIDVLVSSGGYQIQGITGIDPTGYVNVPMETRALDLAEVVVTAYRSNRPLLDQAGAISVVNQKDLSRGDKLVLAPALNRVPGVFMHAGALNTNRITIRGIGARSLFSTNKIRAYLNEIPLTTGDGETTLEDIDLSLVDRVEVLKGPASSLYGAGLGGTINLFTQRPEYKATSLSNALTVGSAGLWRDVVQFRNSSSQAGFIVNVNRTHADGYRENSEYDRTSATVMGQVYANENSTLSFLGSFIHLRGFIPSSLDSATFADNPEKAAFTWAETRGFEEYDKGRIGLAYQHKFSSKESNRKWAAFNGTVFGSFRNSFELRPFNILSESNETVGFRSSFSIFPLDDPTDFRISLGGEYFYEWYDWRTYENVDRQIGLALSDQKEQRSNYNLFAHAEYAIGPKLLISAGVNFNSTRYQVQDLFAGDTIDLSGDHTFDPAISPRVGLNYRVTGSLSVFANVSHGFSPPSVSETLNPNGTVNPDIQPETGWNIEVGSRGYLFRKRIYYDLSVYSMQIRNLLVARRSGNDAFIGINAGATEHNGIEALVQYQVIRKKNRPISLLQIFASYTLARYRFTDFVDGDDDFSGNRLTGTPPHNFSAGIDLETKFGLYGNLNYQFVDRMPIRDDNAVWSESYQLFNLKAGWKRTFWEHLEVDIFGGINNILDEEYASMLLINAGSFGGNAPRYYYPGQPRNYFGGLGLKWIL